MASEPIELAALGRPLFPGMLYDCRSDSFIPGVTLWDKKSLREDLDSRPQPMTDVKFSSSDSLSSKSSLLDVSASLKASFLGGLVVVRGSARYLRNTKSSNQQSRVTMDYSENSRFDQLTMTQLGKITYPEVFEKKTATHVVTAVLYGAQAFMVFERSFAEDENKQDIEGELNVMVKKIPGFSIEGEGAVKMTDEDNKKAENITCTFHGDFHLEQNPTTYLEALEVYKNLPKQLKANPQNAVPIKVWLYPLSLLDTNAARLVREISTRLISNTEDMMEDLAEVERTCNDLSSRTEENVFSDIKARLHSFQDSFINYKMVLQKALARVLPAIRGGGMEEQSLENILKIHSSSPFKADLLNQWLDDAKSELYLLNNHSKTLNEINTEDSDRLNGILLDPDIHVIVCLTFTSLKYNDPYLSTLKEFQKSDKFKELDEKINLPSVTSNIRKWFKDPEVIAKMRENLLVFKKFSEANKNEKNIRFIISAISNPSIPGSSIYLYENGKLTDTKFQPMSKPPTPTVKNVLEHTVSLKLQKSPTGQTVKYRVEYQQVNADSGAEERWLVIDAAYEDFKLTGLEPGKQYLIRYRIVGKVGVSEASDTVSPETLSSLIVDDNSTLRADFIQELLPSAERTALLYHLAFLSLGGFPKLERLIRDQAIETQLLFRSSEALLLKCVGTISNLLTSLFPILKQAVEKNKPVLAVRYLMEAKELIKDIVAQVDDTVKRYDQHRKSVQTCTSDVYREQKETEEKKAEKSNEMKGEIPDPEHLKEVQVCLSQIQQILITLEMFWEKVDSILNMLKEKTFAGEELVDMEDMKDEFLSSIDDAGKHWEIFGLCCQRVQGAFSVQSKDAYKFLEINPSSLSEEERKRQYVSITEKLKKINPDPPALCDTQN
ncbi:stonustoxin subunit alpha-like isoform X3 [Onychostoma macrolepis]|nr:stonustoxin subunit alpha-like isoform X3 [Onychostoma macrolepis]XP_058625866.1 stonustoxin subunit alpha-like isoform X3 [Onychostoma macrolepis]